MKELLEEYRESLRLTKEMRETALEEDRKIYGGMITNLEYAVKWLRDEQQPAPKKSRSVTWDPEWEEYSEHHINPYSFNQFEEVEGRIDAERRRKKRA